MRTGLFNLVQIKPTPVGGNLLRLDISAEEAKSKEFGLSIGYGSYVGGIFGIQYRDLDLFGYGRPLTTSFEITSRSYKGEIAYEDPYLFDSDFQLKTRLYALTFDFDGYSKFELGGRFELGRQFTKTIQGRADFLGAPCRDYDERHSSTGIGRPYQLLCKLAWFHADA